MLQARIGQDHSQVAFKVARSGFRIKEEHLIPACFRIARKCQVTHRDAYSQEEARRLSNSAYNVGSLLLELSLAATNLSQAASGNGGPLLSAQTGFLSTDGSHPHITNRVPSGPPAMDPNMPRAQLQSELFKVPPSC